MSDEEYATVRLRLRLPPVSDPVANPESLIDWDSVLESPTKGAAEEAAGSQVPAPIETGGEALRSPFESSSSSEDEPPPTHSEDEYDPHWWYDGIAPCKEDLLEMLQSGTYRLQSGWDPCDDDEDDLSGDEQDDFPAGGPECELSRPCGDSRGHEACIGDLLPLSLEARVGQRVNCFGGKLRFRYGCPNGLAGTVASARRDVRRGAREDRSEGVVYTVTLDRLQRGKGCIKTLSGERRISVSETAIMFDEFDGSLPTRYYIEGGDEWDKKACDGSFEEDIEAYAQDFGRGVTCCDIRGWCALSEARGEAEYAIFNECLRGARLAAAAAVLQRAVRGWRAREGGAVHARLGKSTGKARKTRQRKKKRGERGTGPPPGRGTDGCRGQQRAPEQDASDKTIGNSFLMPSSASSVVPPTPPAVRGSPPGESATGPPQDRARTDAVGSSELLSRTRATRRSVTVF